MTCPITIASQLKDKLSTNLEACNAKMADLTAVVASKSAEINSFQEAAAAFTTEEQAAIDAFVAVFGNSATLKNEITKDAVAAKLEISKELIDDANQAIVDAQVSAVAYSGACGSMTDSNGKVSHFVTSWNNLVAEVNAEIHALSDEVDQVVTAFMNLVNPPVASAPVSEPVAEPVVEPATETASSESTDATAGEVASGELVSDSTDATTVTA